MVKLITKLLLLAFIPFLSAEQLNGDSDGWTSNVGILKCLDNYSPSKCIQEIKPSACNIEGDRPGYNASMMNSKILWGNVVFTLDAPFSKLSQVHYTFDELINEQKTHGYKCLEASIPNFDQEKVLLTQLFWISYYVEHFSKNRSEGKDPLITIQIHQLPNETDQANIFLRYLPHFYGSMTIQDNTDMYKNAFITTPEGCVNLHIKYGYDVDKDLESDSYQVTQIPAPNSDAYLSFSMAIGYDPTIGPSDAIYPDTFYFLNTHNKTLWNYPFYRKQPDIKMKNDFITQFRSEGFDVKKERIVGKWIDILKNIDPFFPEGKGVIVHEEMNANLISEFRVGSIAKIDGLWSPDSLDQFPIKDWKIVD